MALISTEDDVVIPIRMRKGRTRKESYKWGTSSSTVLHKSLTSATSTAFSQERTLSLTKAMSQATRGDMKSFVLYTLVLSVWYCLALFLFSRHRCGVFWCWRPWGINTSYALHAVQRNSAAFLLQCGMNLNVGTGTINLWVWESFVCCSPVTSLPLHTVQWTQ